jgi:hypothetical protein
MQRLGTHSSRTHHRRQSSARPASHHAVVVVTEGDGYRMREARTPGDRARQPPDPLRPAQGLSLAAGADFRLPLNHPGRPTAGALRATTILRAITPDAPWRGVHNDAGRPPRLSATSARNRRSVVDKMSFQQSGGETSIVTASNTVITTPSPSRRRRRATPRRGTQPATTVSFGWSSGSNRSRISSPHWVAVVGEVGRTQLGGAMENVDARTIIAGHLRSLGDSKYGGVINGLGVERCALRGA